MATTLVSALTRIPVRRDVAMTGEITLRGKVLPIGGVKEKVLAAYRAGLREVILPKSNEKDLRDVPDEVRANMAFTFVQSMDEVLRLALLPAPIIADKQLADATLPVEALPFVYPHVAVMPDVHLGKGATVGSVIPTKAAIIPSAARFRRPQVIR